MKNTIRKYFFLIGIHLSLFFTIYLIFSFLGFIKGFPTNESLSQWDVGWYKSIKNSGYSFHIDSQSNVAFFPLFPLIWKFSTLSSVGISIVNLMCLYIGVYFLFKSYNLDAKKTLMILSVPSLLFCYVPYSEAIFFLAGSLIIYGFKKNNWISVLGVFMACLARSASLIFIPILIFAKLYNYKIGAENRKVIKETLILVLSAIVSTLFAQYIQYLDTGAFFAIFKAQESWGRVMSIPTLYFTTWDEARLIWLDGLAFLVGICCVFFCIVLLVKKFSNLKKKRSTDYLFSIAYLATVTIVTMLYSGLDAKGGTSLYSLNRFVFSTPFFMVFLIVLMKRNWLIKKHIIFFVSISIITWFLFNANGYLHGLDKFVFPYFKTKIYFGIVSLYSFLFLLLSDKNYNSFLWSGLYLFNLILQIFLFNSFLNGTWIG